MKVVLSASRRTDLVASYPNEFIRSLDAYPPQAVHSIVIWTKNARNMLGHRALSETLRRYDQLFLHFSITGMGGSALEPGIPPMEESLELLPGLIEMVKGPERISVRFDPIVNLRMDNRAYTNLDRFPEIAKELSQLGIKRVTTSWMTVYKKVTRRLEYYGIEPISFDWQQQADFLLDQCRQWGLQLHACCVEGMPLSRCIDGPALQALHPKGEKCSQAKAGGQRPGCGCTASKDIGWYSQICGGGCVYCYASPAIPSQTPTLESTLAEHAGVEI